VWWAAQPALHDASLPCLSLPLREKKKAGAKKSKVT
jgi:hypothetical protein